MTARTLHGVTTETMECVRVSEGARGDGWPNSEIASGHGASLALVLPSGPACRHSARTELGAQPTRAREGAVIPEPTGRVSCRVSRANQVAMEGIGKGYGMMAGGLGLAIG